jgi:hypothetical protein
MAISLTVTESTQEIVANVPKYLTITTSIPAAVFYTLDGTDPDSGSSIVEGDTLSLPTDVNPLTVKLIALTNDDSSSTFEGTYKSSLVGAFIARAADANATTLVPDYFPFGGSGHATKHKFGQQIGTITNAAGSTTIPDGYDANGNSVGSLNLPASSYTFFGSATNRLGETGRGIGTLPSDVTIRVPEAPPESSSTNSKFFNAKAQVIYQSYEDIENQDVALINRRFFDTNEPSRDQPAAYSYNAYQGVKVHGSALRPIYNEKDQTLTFPYRDSYNGRWIFSKEKLTPTTQDTGNILLSPRSRVNALVLKWYPYFRKRII